MEKLRETKAKYEEIAQELAQERDKLTKQLDTLKADWHTQAGIDFFQKQDLDWKSQVNSYIKITEGISQLLECAIDQYTQVEEAAMALRLKD